MSAKKASVYWVMILCLAALIGGMLLANRKPPAKMQDLSAFHGTFLPKPRSIQTFALKSTDDKAFDNQSLKGQWTLMFFGFTRCASICPATMAEIGQMYKILENNKVQKMPQVVMVSLDPKRDSLESLNAYVKTFDPHFMGARGNSKAVKQFAHEMGIAYAKVALKDNKDSENYDIQHTGTIMLFNPEGKLNAFFTMPHEAEKLAEDYARLVKQG